MKMVCMIILNNNKGTSAKVRLEPPSFAFSAVKEEKKNPRIKVWCKATFFSRNTNLMMFFIFISLPR